MRRSYADSTCVYSSNVLRLSEMLCRVSTTAEHERASCAARLRVQRADVEPHGRGEVRRGTVRCARGRALASYHVIEDLREGEGGPVLDNDRVRCRHSGFLLELKLGQIYMISKFLKLQVPKQMMLYQNLMSIVWPSNNP